MFFWHIIICFTFIHYIKASRGMKLKQIFDSKQMIVKKTYEKQSHLMENIHLRLVYRPILNKEKSFCFISVKSLIRQLGRASLIALWPGVASPRSAALSTEITLNKVWAGQTDPLLAQLIWHRTWAKYQMG